MSLAERLESLGIRIPPAPKPVASYVPAVRTGNLVYTAGQLPYVEGRLPYTGRVGAEVTPEQAQDAARAAALNALAAVGTVVDDLNRISRVVHVTGYVNSAADFTGQPGVLNGASDLLVALFGAAGRHSRAAIGVYQLPLEAPVEVDLLVEVAAD